jgi:hypothetical protein
VERIDRINTRKKKMDEKEFIRETEACNVLYVHVVEAAIYFQYIQRHHCSYICIAPNVTVLASNELQGIWKGKSPDVI